MKRLAGTCVGVLLLGLVAVPAWADHSTPTGIDCLDFTYQEEAQAYFDAHPGDPEGLDGPIGPTSSGIPNVACENRPPRPTTTSTTVASDTRIIPVTTTTLRPAAPATAVPATAARRAITLTG